MKKNKKLIWFFCVILPLLFLGVLVIIAQSNKEEVTSYTGSFDDGCRRRCEEVGWDDAKFNDILNKNDGISNMCSSYYCSEHRPSNQTPPSIKEETFYGYNCKGDCSGHKAGYDWANKNNITDFDGCVGKSNSFIEGCMAYIQGQNNLDARW